ncbi:hypothetical protein ASC78_14480 [Variovorax sp. Root318D1]|uniref:hypothetical protein n=1 Tax=Variovorax sp. Root318D1 TaxID=1736513 RepID=UPI0006F928A4|nr:hypothetical protein [Variovorax sp. Root318D1]KQU83824.1 hypothetical protein ASC78_14480 [Variovorax sp. Root318D1]
MDIWEQILWVVFAVMMGGALVACISVAVVATSEQRKYTKEQRVGKALGGTGVPAQGTVLEVRRPEHQLTSPGTHGQRMVALELDLQMGPAAQVPTVVLRTLVDELLLPRIAVPGATIHLLQDPANPAVVSVDRQRTPLEVPPAQG